MKQFPTINFFFLKIYTYLHKLKYDSKQLASIVLFFVLSVMFLFVYTTKLERKVKTEKEFIFYLESLVKLEKDKNNLKKEIKQVKQVVKGHSAYNESIEELKEETRQFEAYVEEQKTNIRNSMKDAKDYNGDIIIESEKRILKTKELLITKTIANKTKNSSVKCFLEERNVLSIPTPIYKCPKGGIVVVNISVDELGIVYKVKVNKTLTKSRDRCLFDNAIKYAKRALFDASDKMSQNGTITFIFDDRQS